VVGICEYCNAKFSADPVDYLFTSVAADESWGKKKFLSLFGRHLSAKELLESHHNFVMGHRRFPEACFL
jgi:hypothetical protein